MTFISVRNFKSGRLIAGRYTFPDLLILISGAVLSAVLEALYIIFFLSKNTALDILFVSLLTLPGLAGLFLTSTYDIYHNWLDFFLLCLIYLFSDRRFIWKGLERK